MYKLLVPAIATDCVFLTLAELDRANRGKVLRVLRNFDQVFGLGAFGNLNLAFLPHARYVRLPCLPHAANKAVGPAQQENVWAQSIAARKNAQILQNNSFK